MKINRLDILLDGKTIFIGFLVLILPISVYLLIIIHHERDEKFREIHASTDGAISEFEILLDHLNGALINLRNIGSDCNDSVLELMNELSFGLPGVEAFYILDAGGQTLCTDWLSNYSSFSKEMHRYKNGLNISGEHYFEKISQTGIYVYRRNSQQQFVGALISSAFLRKILNLGVPNEDILAFYNRTTHTQIAINGLNSKDRLEIIDNALVQGRDDYWEKYKGGSKVIVKASSQYPEIVAVYLHKTQSSYQIIRTNAIEFIGMAILSAFLLWVWLVYRFQIVNSYRYQLNQAIIAREFVPYFQPIVDIANNQWVGVEVLARWVRHGHHVAFPDEFIGKAEQYNLLKPLTRQVVDKACEQLEQFIEIRPNLYFTVNLSPNQVDEDTLKAVHFFAQKYPKLKPENIRFEITEQGLADANKPDFQKTVEALRALGFKFGLDDFGTGQSGLEYFSNLSPDFLKIDRRFVASISNPHSVDFQLLKTIVQLAKSLAITIVAEGIENKQQEEWLLTQGIRYGQGWYYRKPMDTNLFIETFSLISK